jgi:hypothetical protein
MERNGCDKLNVPFRYFCAQTEKPHENVSDDGRSPRQDMNPGYSEPGVLTQPV